MDEKRKASRIEKGLIAQYSLCLSGPACWDSTTIKNISTDGMLLCTNRNFEKGQELLLRFKIPSNPMNWLNAKGKVIESAQCKTRVKFIEIDEAQKKNIQEYVAWFIQKNQPDKS